MKVILKQTVPKVGKEGQVVNVKNGYARNFLFPRSLAIVADDKQLAALGRRHAKIEQLLSDTKSGAEQIKEKLHGPPRTSPMRSRSSLAFLSRSDRSALLSRSSDLATTRLKSTSTETSMPSSPFAYSTRRTPKSKPSRSSPKPRPKKKLPKPKLYTSTRKPLEGIQPRAVLLSIGEVRADHLREWRTL